MSHEERGPDLQGPGRPDAAPDPPGAQDRRAVGRDHRVPVQHLRPVHLPPSRDPRGRRHHLRSPRGQSHPLPARAGASVERARRLPQRHLPEPDHAEPEGVEKEGFMRVAIAGGTGFIRSHLARLLAASGHDVALLTLLLFATEGLTERPLRPLAVEDLVPVLAASLTGGRLSRETVAVTGPEALSLAEAARRVAGVLGRKVVIARAPVWVHRLLARVFEGTMKIPLVSLAQVRILAEGVTAAAPPAADLPPDLRPSRWFTAEQIRKGLPEPRRFGLADLRGCG